MLSPSNTPNQAHRGKIALSEKSKDSCACTQRLLDLMRAGAKKNDLLRKVTCPKCGKDYWTNADNDVCFDCKSK